MVSQELLSIIMGCGGWMGVIYAMIVLNDGAKLDTNKVAKLILSVPLGGVISALLTICLKSTYMTVVQIFRGMLHPVAFSLYFTALFITFLVNELIKEEATSFLDSDSEDKNSEIICRRSLASAPRMCE